MDDWVHRFASPLRWLVVGAAVSLAACSGGASPGVIPGARATAAAPTAPPVPGAQSADVVVAFKIPAKTTASRARNFVSPSTNGVLVQIYTDPQTAGAAPVATAAIDVSASSKACMPVSGSGRTCSFTLAIAGGTYDFVDTLYDAAPVNGGFGAAKVLGTGRVTQTIVYHTTNTVAVSIGGTVASIVLGPVRQVALNSQPASYALSVTARDADGNTIVAGTSDPYANPITIAASDSGGHTTLVLNGGAPSPSITTAQSSDSIEVAYDGQGAAGYFATFSASASGAPPATSGFDSFNVTLTLVSFLGTGQTQTETIVEPHNTGPFVVTPAANCASVTAAGPLSGTGSTETFVLSSGTKAATCYVEVASETGVVSVPVKVVNLVPAQVTVPAHRLFVGLRGTGTVQAFDVANGGALVQTISGSATTLSLVSGIARDSAGALHVSDLSAGTVTTFASDASGNVAPLATLILPPDPGATHGIPNGVAVDRAGDVFVSDLFGSNLLSVFAPGASGAATPVIQVTNSCYGSFSVNSGVVTDPSGQAYVLSSCASEALVQITPYGAASPARTIVTSYTTPAGVALDTQGDVYVTGSGGTTFIEYGPDAFGPAAPLRTGTGLTSPSGIAVANDGTVYVLENPMVAGSAISAIAVYPPGATTPASTFQIAPSAESGSLAL